ncbi:MAG: XkdX family protein [Clostridia bacterium]|nr:XkdX family protein [Clostridia bacterium]
MNRYEDVKNYYIRGIWTKVMVRNAVGRWITEEEFKQITGDDYE